MNKKQKTMLWRIITAAVLMVALHFVPVTGLPRFALYAGEEYLGCIRKEFALFHPRFTLDCNGWEVEGSFLEWDYAVTDPAGRTVMAASKELLHWTDTYVLDIARPEDALLCLMIVLPIDAAKCSAGNG